MKKVLTAVASLAFATACGSSGGDAADSGAEPVPIGMISMEGVARATLENVRLGSEAAVRYFNAERGGLQGRPIKLFSCKTNGSAESSAACAHQMVEHRVIAVRGGIDIGSGASLPILKAAGLAYVGPVPLLPPDFTTDGAFTFSPGTLGGAVIAKHVATTLKAKRVAILQADDAPGKTLVDKFVKPVLARGGVSPAATTTHVEQVNAADLTPVVQAAAQTHPDAVIVLFPPPACPRIMQAAVQLRVSVPMFYVEPCGTLDVLHAAGAGADGAYFYRSLLNIQANKNDADVKLYLDKIGEYGKGADRTSSETQTGFALTMTVLDRLATIKGDLTPAAVTTAFRTAVDAPAFMGHSFTCDGKQSAPTFISVCSSYVRLYQFNHGRYRDVLGSWVSAADALAG